MLVLFLAFAFLGRCDEFSDLPFEDEKPEATKEEVIDSEEQQSEQEAVDEDENVEPPPPTPTPEKVRIPLKNILSLREVAVAASFVVYIIVYLIGKANINKKKQIIENKLFSLLREDYFAVVPDTFQRMNPHLHKTYVTGRTGYKLGVISAQFKNCCDPLGIIYAILTGKKDKLTFEFVLEPPREPLAYMRVAHSKPEYFDQLKLKSTQLEEHMHAYNDFGDARTPFVSAITQFQENRPKTLQFIELSDDNQFETRLEGRFVAKFEFYMPDDIEDFIDADFVNFVMGIADDYITIKLGEGQRTKNLDIRKSLLRAKKVEEEKKKEAERKPTKEEIEKAEKKAERREKSKLRPKFKTQRVWVNIDDFFG